MPFKKCMYTAGLLIGLLGFTPRIHAQNTPLKGAWETVTQNGINKVVIATDHYLVQSTYDTADGQFLESLGGPYTLNDEAIIVTLDFHSKEGQLTGRTYTLPIQRNGNTLVLTNEDGSQETWHRLDAGKGPLAGCWQISQRQQDGQMHPLPDGHRKTLKMLSGTRFQWTAFNAATGQFFGCGGGHYTFANGKYTEYIDYFSKDDSRVGLSLRFYGEVRDSLWYHKGKSTKGDPVYEIWKLK